MSIRRFGVAKTTMVLATVLLVLAASFGASYLNTASILNAQSQSVSRLQSAFDSLASHPEVSTVIQTATTTSTRTQTVTSQSNFTLSEILTTTKTLTDTTTQTEFTSTTTRTIANTTIPWSGLDYMTADSGCTTYVPGGSPVYPVPCFGPNSSAYAFNCAAAAATSQGCTQVVNIIGTSPKPNFTITVWYPYNYQGEQLSQNCKWTESIPNPPGPESEYAYCISLNSTAFFVTESAPGVA